MENGAKVVKRQGERKEKIVLKTDSEPLHCSNRQYAGRESGKNLFRNGFWINRNSQAHSIPLFLLMVFLHKR